MGLVKWKSLPFMLVTFWPLGATSFAGRFPATFFDFFAFDEFFLIAIALTSVSRGA
jgi:hypothetical protein